MAADVELEGLALNQSSVQETGRGVHMKQLPAHTCHIPIALHHPRQSHLQVRPRLDVYMDCIRFLNCQSVLKKKIRWFNYVEMWHETWLLYRRVRHMIIVIPESSSSNGFFKVQDITLRGFDPHNRGTRAFVSEIINIRFEDCSSYHSVSHWASKFSVDCKNVL